MAIKKNISIENLHQGNSKLVDEMKPIKYGRLSIICYAGDINYNGRYTKILVAQCDCGNINTYRANHVKLGRSKSCGCLQAELTSNNKVKHGQKRKNKIRGTKVYSVWQSMLYRCKNSIKYINDGIIVCDEWKLFTHFYKDMGDAPTQLHTLDRIDNKAGYYKENCRWATMLEQGNNTRRNVRIVISEKSYTLSEAMRFLGLGRREVQTISAAQNGKTYHGVSKERIEKYKQSVELNTIK